VIFATCIFRRFGRITKSNYELRHVCLSVRSHGATRLPLEGIPWNPILDDFSKILPENLSLIKIRQKQRVLYMMAYVNYMMAYVHLWQYLAELFFKSQLFQTNLVEKIKTHILRSKIVFSENRTVYEMMCRNVVETEWPQIAIQCSACALRAGWLRLQNSFKVWNIYFFSTTRLTEAPLDVMYIRIYIQGGPKVGIQYILFLCSILKFPAIIHNTYKEKNNYCIPTFAHPVYIYTYIHIYIYMCVCVCT